MKKALILSLLVAASTSITALADTVRVVGLAFSAHQAGEFTVLPGGFNNSGFAPTTRNFVQPGTFETFCLEADEPITPGVTYNATPSLTTTTGIPLSKGAAWLFEQFAKGILAGYSYGGTTDQRKDSANALQQEIWHLMGNQAALDPILHALVTAALGASVLDNAGPGDTTVRVLNVVLDGEDFQDILYIPGVPDGGLTLALLGMGLTGVGVISRRVRK